MGSEPRVKHLSLLFLLLTAFSPARAQEQENAPPEVEETYTENTAGSKYSIDLKDPLKKAVSIPVKELLNYREEMRQILITLGEYARGRDKKFRIVIRGGENLVRFGGWEHHLAELKEARKLSEEEMRSKERALMSIPNTGSPMRHLLRLVDGMIFENIYCGKEKIPEDINKNLKKRNIRRLSVEHCKERDPLPVMAEAASDGVLAFVPPDPEAPFSRLPRQRPFGENSDNVLSLGSAKNMLMMIDAPRFDTREEWLVALENTNYDLLVVDPFFQGDESMTKEEVHSLKFKKFGARRLVLAHMRVDQAEDTRFYWRDVWRLGQPSWLRAPAPDNPAGLITAYWTPEWQEIVGRYFKGIMDLGFAGVVLDGVDAHIYFESLTPLE